MRHLGSSGELFVKRGSPALCEVKRRWGIWRAHRYGDLNPFLSPTLPAAPRAFCFLKGESDLEMQ